MTGRWIKLHNEKLHILHYSTSIITANNSWRMRLKNHVARIVYEMKVYRLLVRKVDIKRPLGRPRRRWVNNIDVDLGEIEWSSTDYIDLPQDKDKGGLLCTR
jgi:hypothetical protein